MIVWSKRDKGDMVVYIKQHKRIALAMEKKTLRFQFERRVKTRRRKIWVMKK